MSADEGGIGANLRLSQIKVSDPLIAHLEKVVDLKPVEGCDGRAQARKRIHHFDHVPDRGLRRLRDRGRYGQLASPPQKKTPGVPPARRLAAGGLNEPGSFRHRSD